MMIVTKKTGDLRNRGEEKKNGEKRRSGGSLGERGREEEVMGMILLTPWIQPLTVMFQEVLGQQGWRMVEEKEGLIVRPLVQFSNKDHIQALETFLERMLSGRGNK